MLSREEMVRVIEGGGSICHNGAILTHVNQLPKEEQIASTPDEKALAAQKLQSQIDELNARLASITPPEETKPATPAKSAAATTAVPPKAAVKPEGN